MATETRVEFDKSTWGDGPWQTEPDRVEFEHAGLPCLLQRNRSGAWCGYVAVPPTHPLHDVGYDDGSPALQAALEQLKERRVTDSDLTFTRMIAMLSGDVQPSPGLVLDVHGGLTYADRCQGVICHVPKPGEPDDVWWFGFDCSHAGDYSPTYGAEYWGRGYPWPDKPYTHTEALAANDWHIEVYRDVAYARTETERLAEQLSQLIGTPGDGGRDGD